MPPGQITYARADVAPMSPPVLDGPVNTTWDEEFQPSAGALSVLRWAYAHGASTVGEAYDMLEQLAVSNDVPEVLGHEDTVEDIRDELELGMELVGADAALTDLV
jgi:hypothetical protein